MLLPHRPPPPAGAEPPAFQPAYLALHRRGELKRRADVLWARMERCDLCPRQCMVNRLDGDPGLCRSTAEPVVSSHQPHFGEERELVGAGGSGTIFFTCCNARCVFGINWPISQAGDGRGVSVEALANMMLSLQRKGCVNINRVTPPHRGAHPGANSFLKSEAPQPHAPPLRKLKNSSSSAASRSEPAAEWS